MINEELKTFIVKMRAAGKTDPEIVAELKMAGWSEKDALAATAVDRGKTFFTPRGVWDILIIIPLVYFALFELFLSTFIQPLLSAFSSPFSATYGSFATAGRSVMLFWLMFPIHFAAMAIIVLDIVYLFNNRQKIAPTAEMLIKWSALVILFGPFAMLFAHFRYLKSWSTRKCIILVSVAAAVILTITAVQAARIFVAVSRFQEKATPWLNLMKEPEFNDRVRELMVSDGQSSPPSPILASDGDLEVSFYESSDIGNASTVKIHPPKGWYGSVWGSVPNLAVVLKPIGYTVKEYSYPFVDINIVQVGTKSVSVISPNDNALLEKWIINNNVLPPKNDQEYSVNIISREFRKFQIGYGVSNAYYVEFDLFSNKPQDTKDGPVSKLKFARILVEAKHPNFAFDIKVVDTLENWNKNKGIIYKSLATLTGRGSVENGEGL